MKQRAGGPKTTVPVMPSLTEVLKLPLLGRNCFAIFYVAMILLLQGSR